MTSPNHLILVCCHAIYLTGTGPTKGTSATEWLLSPFQTAEIPTLTSHAQAGLSLLASDPRALLVFSGSKTRKETPTSEAQSYLDLCLDNDFWGIGVGEARRLLVEEQALDSFGNLLFGMLRFWREVGAWPGRISIVSQGFKRARFLELHVAALRYPRERVGFLGTVPPCMVEGGEGFDAVMAEGIRKGEREAGFGLWERDLLGVGEVLKGKRRGRNWWGVSLVWFVDEEERVRSGVKTKAVEVDGIVEEVLGQERQPWEVPLELET